MRLTKRQLKQIIREEYSRLQRNTKSQSIREGRIGYDEREGNMAPGGTDLMDVAEDAFYMGEGDVIINHWMQKLGVAAFETGEVDEEDFMAIERFASDYNPNTFDADYMAEFISNLSADAVELLSVG